MARVLSGCRFGYSDQVLLIGLRVWERQKVIGWDQMVNCGAERDRAHLFLFVFFHPSYMTYLYCPCSQRRLDPYTRLLL